MSNPLCHGSGAASVTIGWYQADRHDSRPGAGGRWLQQIRLWRSRHRQRRALADVAAMNNHLLRDIGTSLQDAQREAVKPFWRT